MDLHAWICMHVCRCMHSQSHLAAVEWGKQSIQVVTKNIVHWKRSALSRKPLWCELWVKLLVAVSVVSGTSTGDPRGLWQTLALHQPKGTALVSDKKILCFVSLHGTIFLLKCDSFHFFSRVIFYNDLELLEMRLGQAQAQRPGLYLRLTKNKSTTRP